MQARFGLIWPSGLREDVKNMKSLQTDGGTDGQRITGDQKSPPEPGLGVLTIKDEQVR